MELSNYFLQPQNLAALAGLLALILFYLVKKKPEEQVMPSMAFFMHRKKEGRIQHAIRQLLHNMVLLLQVLIVIGLAAALAHPYVNQETTAENAVIIFDNSASMSNNLEEAKEFATNNLGESNTVITANSETKILLQDAQRATARSEIQDLQAVDTGTDISSALRAAQNYEGQIVLASDLDDSNQEIDVAGELTEAEREYRTMETSPENAAGIIDISASRESVSVDVKNFLENEKEISYTVNEDENSVNVPGNSVETVEFEPEDGRNTLELNEDGLESDNAAYTYIPEQRKSEAVLISDTGNRHLEKALELIDFVDLEVARPPLDQPPEADIYIIGETDRAISTTLDSIENDVREGKSLVVFGQEGLIDLGMESLPAEIQGGWKNSTVEINKPVKTSLQTSIIKSEKTTGESLTTPGEAIIRDKYGIGDVLFYNIDDEDFRSNFLYPVFWKQNLKDMTERPSVSERNLHTGETINATKVTTPSGEDKSSSTVVEAGFYNTSKGVYAANLLNEDESSEEPSEAENSGGAETEQRDIQNLLTAAVLLLLIGEAAYLRRLGEL